MDLVISKLDDVRGDNRSTRATIWVVGLGLAAIMIAIATLAATLAPTFFGMGIRMGSAARVESPTTEPTKP